MNEQKIMKVHDNFLNKIYHREILDLMNGPEFSWFYSNNINLDGRTNTNDNLEEHGFSHIFWEYPNGSRHTMQTQFILPLLYNIVDIIGANEILRARGDMTMYSSVGFKHKTHVDFEFPNIATVYYVNDSDGNTVCLDQQVEPKANRLVIFSGEIPHTGHSPSKHKTRIVINSNYKK